MANAGSALMGIGHATGEKRAELAARAAINSPLLEVSITGAKGVLFSIAGGDDLGMLEVQDAANVITEAIDQDAKVIFGAVTDETLKKGQVRVTVIATGFPEGNNVRASLIPSTQRYVTRKDQDVPPISRAHEEKRPEPVIKPVIKEQPKPTPPPTKTSEDDDDSWGGLPSFLRRS
jgi:cell division protein FtsZ